MWIASHLTSTCQPSRRSSAPHHAFPASPLSCNSGIEWPNRAVGSSDRALASLTLHPLRQTLLVIGVRSQTLSKALADNQSALAARLFPFATEPEERLATREVKFCDRRGSRPGA